jgi:hypothetical protein
MKNLTKVILRTTASILTPVVNEPLTTGAEPLAEDNAYIVTQEDLLTLESVLVSTGMNDNDDLFLAQELIGARGTGRHKPVNIEHDDLQIVGHMTESFVAMKTGERINEAVLLEESERLPANFDLVSRAVVYAYIFPELAREIRERAAHNELFVSVEAWFQDYDYIVGTRIVRRNAETSEKLEPILRINGGSGQINGQRLGRVLRGLIIGGKGLVEAPANKDSVIRSVSCEVEANSIVDLLDKNTIGHFVDNAFIPLEGETEATVHVEEEDMKKAEAAKKAAEEKGKKTKPEEEESEATHHKDKKKKEAKEGEKCDKEKKARKTKADDEETQEESTDTTAVTEDESTEEDEDKAQDQEADDTPAEQEQTESDTESKSADEEWASRLQEMNDRLANIETSSKADKEEIEKLRGLLDTKDKDIKELNEKLEKLEKQPEESKTADSDAGSEQSGDDKPEDKPEAKDTKPADTGKESEPESEVDDSAIEDALDNALDNADKEEDPVDFSGAEEEADEELQGEFKDVLTQLGMLPNEEGKDKGGS